MPRNVTISADVGVLMKISSVPAAFEYCREWARKMLRLQKPEPCVDLMPAAPKAPPMPIAMPKLIVEAAAAPFRNLRREATAAPEKSMSASLGKCVQPMRSHMMASSGSRDRCQEISAGWDLGSDDSIVGTPTGKN